MYANADRVTWPPSKIFGDEIRILGSFSEVYMFRTFVIPTPRQELPGQVS